MTKQLDAGIYKITNLVNQKVYIGQSRRLQTRLRKHREALKGNYHQNLHLQRSYNKYTSESFKFEIIQYVDNLEELTYWEQYYIDFYESYDSTKGYNKARYVQQIYYPTEETREKISKGNKGKIITLEHRKKASDSNKRKSKENKPNLSTGITNINYLKREKYYSVSFSIMRKKITIEAIKDLNFAILIRDIFYDYKLETAQEYKQIIKQCLKTTGYFNVRYIKTNDSYLTNIRIKDKNYHIKSSKNKELCALAYNEYVINNSLNLPLNIVPLSSGVFKENKWYCEIN